ncbi:hypothetical protein MYP_4865 [Sporocytophaga myxococcoides]|uniref:Uncharacterized protein n=1 Tax=Sporocytophaga myxococcoides TaxID=153721 RepID=A0A098LKY0_9BACT|nr:hypothetical protein [Sporocytophaga myxococcoides]GAL87635.1 hypothetical protein MYP_4865 [Sporocytophaga myxococcoides]
MREQYKYEDQYIKLTEVVNKKIKILIEQISGDFKNIVSFIKGYSIHDNFKNHHEPIIPSDDIISSITTNLQYQDILSQRLDHIIMINTLIIQELKNTEHANGGSTELITYSGKITEVNIRQLEDAYNEYISICSILRKDLDKFEKQNRLKNSNTLSPFIPFKNSLKIATLVSEIKQNLKVMTSINFEVSDSGQSIDQAAMKVQSIYTMQSEREILYSCIPDMQEKYRITFNNDNDIFF